MGNAVNFFDKDERGRCSEYESMAPAKIINGVKGHIIKKKGDAASHTNLPYYANTSDLYFRQNRNGVCQARLYINNRTFLDLDWSHNHTNTNNGRQFAVGVVHVQYWQKDDNGRFLRSNSDARYMNNEEIKKYGPIIRYYCPTVKFRSGR